MHLLLVESLHGYCHTATQNQCFMHTCGLRAHLPQAGMKCMLCAGLESMTQVFSVISSCIVDESVGRCSPCSVLTHPNLSCALTQQTAPCSHTFSCRTEQLLDLRHGPEQAPADMQLHQGHA